MVYTILQPAGWWCGGVVSLAYIGFSSSLIGYLVTVSTVLGSTDILFCSEFCICRTSFIVSINCYCRTWVICMWLNYQSLWYIKCIKNSENKHCWVRVVIKANIIKNQDLLLGMLISFFSKNRLSFWKNQFFSIVEFGPGCGLLCNVPRARSCCTHVGGRSL